jgi:glutathione S-transferase
MSQAVLTISSRNYSSWSLRGWLLCRMAGLDFVEKAVPTDDPSMRAELLMLTPSFLVPRLEHDGVVVWDALAIAGYLAETFPEAGLLPADRKARAHCRSICGEMHQGFFNLRSALPMNLQVRHQGFKVWQGARNDIERIFAIWRDCLSAYGGPYLFGDKPTMADAMFAPVCTRFHSYDVEMDSVCRDYVTVIRNWPPLVEWTAAARAEPDHYKELDAEF